MDRPRGKGNNPETEFVKSIKTNFRFVVDNAIDLTLLVSATSG